MAVRGREADRVPAADRLRGSQAPEVADKPVNREAAEAAPPVSQVREAAHQAQGAAGPWAMAAAPTAPDPAAPAEPSVKGSATKAAQIVPAADPQDPVARPTANFTK